MMDFILVAATAGCAMAALVWYVRGLCFHAQRVLLLKPGRKRAAEGKYRA